MAKRATIREVAKASGVSVSTASYALRNDPRVKEETRVKVQQVAEELGYQVTSAVSNWMKLLRTGGEVADRETLAYVLTEFMFRENAAARAFFEGGRVRAREHGYKLEKFVYDETKMTERRLSDILKARGIRGVVVGPLQENSKYFDLDWSSFAAAGFNLFWWDPPVPRVCNDEYTKVVTAVGMAHEYGYRRPSMAIFSGLDGRYLNAFTAAFMRTVETLEGMEYVKPFLGDKDSFNQKNFEHWYRQAKPDCLMGSRCLHPFLEKMGVKVPEDVGYISLNRRGATRKSAGLDVDLELVGANAVDLVVTQLNRNFFGIPKTPLTTLIGAVWEDGPTIVRH